MDKEELEKLKFTKEVIANKINLNANILKRDQAQVSEAANFLLNLNNDASDEALSLNELKLAKSSANLSFTTLEKLRKMVDKPYFGRVDFTNEWGFNKYYFGIATLKDEDSIVVHDWRTPIANLYYNGEIGKASYQAPMGTINGEISLKRQYKFEDGQLKFYIDTTYNLNDDMLINYLHSNEVLMRNIVSTIQKEQNIAIRHQDNEDLLVLGVAGSGKSSLALHRVAYLMYRDSFKYTSNKVAFLSPSDIFSKYIDDVLPSLGEQNIQEFNLNIIANKLLRRELREAGLTLEPKENYYDRLMDDKRKTYLADEAIVKLLDQFLIMKENSFFNYDAVLKVSDIVIDAYSLSDLYFVNYKGKYLSTKKKLIKDQVYSQIKQIKKITSIEGEAKVLIENFIDELIVEPDYFKLLKEFLSMIDEKKSITIKNQLRYEYVYTLLYMKITFKECRVYHGYNHLLIDEVQDLSPLELKVIKLLFKCRKTILGDQNQMLIPNNFFLENLKMPILFLKNAYRSSINIFNFLKQLVNLDGITPFNRENEDPKIFGFNTEGAQVKYLRNFIRNYKGDSLAIITKNKASAQTLYRKLRTEKNVYHLSNKSKVINKGVSIGTIYTMKGLEFSDVIVYEASANNYYRDIDKNYLYIACSRALHTLTLTHVGDLTPFLNKES